MSENRHNQNLFKRILRRPFKIIRNFLKVQVIVSIFAVAYMFLKPLEPLPQYNKIITENVLFTKGELAEFNGENGKPLYLSLLGSIFDVSKGRKHYGPDCAYNFFVGRDASVSFITGEFNEFDEDKSDDVISQVSGKDLLGLENWKKFYEKDYVYKGKLIGRFYDNDGMPTKYHYKFLALVDQARQADLASEHMSTLYPDCNIEWKESSGTRVWCTKSSGGKNREWIGYPRKLFELGKKDFRCACVRDEDLETTAVMLKPYENCDTYSYECFYRVD